MKKLFLFLLLLSVLNEAPMLSPITVTTYQTEKVLPSTIIHKTLVINSYIKNKETFHGYYSWPQFPKDFSYAKALNSFFQNQFFDDYLKVKAIQINSSKNIFPTEVYSYDHTFEVSFLSQKYLSILENTYIFSGGAHPDIQNRAHTFSLITGKELTLEDLFPITKEDLVNRIKFRIINEIKNNPEEYYPDASNIIDSMQLESFNFYIKNDHVVIFFNPYDIAPYAKGLTEFIIG